jgi:hypothetical protein
VWRSISSAVYSTLPQRRTVLRIAVIMRPANEAWRRYVLIEGVLRGCEDLLDEGVQLSKVAIDLWLQR